MAEMTLLSLPLQSPEALMALVFLFVFLLVPILTRVKLPPMIGVAILGMGLGPLGLGLFGRAPVLDVLGDLGLLFVFFLSGLELEAFQVKRLRPESAVFGLLSFLLPFAGGFLGGLLLFGFSPVAALALGAFLASHSLPSQAGLSRLRLNRLGPISKTLQGGSLVGALGLVCLSASILLSRGHSPMGLGISALAILALLFLAYFALPRLSAFVFSKLRPDGSVEFAYVAVLLFGLASLARLAGLEPAIGAFLAGRTLRRLIPEHSILMDRLRFSATKLFVPFFFLGAGMLADVRPFARGLSDGTGTLLGFTLFIVLASLILKLAAALATRPLWRAKWAEIIMTFALSASHSSFSLGIAFLAQREGLLSPGQFACAFLLYAISCVLGDKLTELQSRSLLADLDPEGQGEGEVQERLMVMVSHPERTRRLFEMATTLRPNDSSEPIYPVNVIREGDDVEAQIAASEQLLAKMVVQALSTGLTAVPVTRVSYNVSEAVVQAAHDHRISTIVVGAGPRGQSLKRPYGGLVDQFVSVSRQMVIIHDLGKPISTYGQVYAVMPPLSERHPGFSRGVAAIKTMGQRLGAKLTLVSLDHGMDSLRSAFNAHKPAYPFQTIALSSWRDLASKAKRHSPGANAFFALVNVRQGSLAWQPAIDKLPGYLLEEDPECPMVCVYLAEESEQAAFPALASRPGPEGSNPFLQALLAQRVRLWSEPKAMADALGELVAPAFKDKRHTLSRLSARLLEIAQKEPVPLAEGIVLIHAHVEEVGEPLVFFGVSPVGIPLLSLGVPAKVLLVLLAPLEQPPEDHLKILSGLAALVMDESFSLALKKATTMAELEALARLPQGANDASQKKD